MVTERQTRKSSLAQRIRNEQRDWSKSLVALVETHGHHTEYDWPLPPPPPGPLPATEHYPSHMLIQVRSRPPTTPTPAPTRNNSPSSQRPLRSRPENMVRCTCLLSYLTFLTVVALVVVMMLIADAFFIGRVTQLGERIASYEYMRKSMLRREGQLQLGAKIELTEAEHFVNERLKAVKNSEYELGQRNGSYFLPAQNFLVAHEQISETPLFHFLQSMPKGGVLHAHDVALCSTAFLVDDLSYRRDLWLCLDKVSNEYMSLRFARNRPEQGQCEWVLLQALRKKVGAAVVDQQLSERLSMQPPQRNSTSENKGNIDEEAEAWRSFNNIIRFVHGLLTYKPVWSDYYYHGLEEYYADGVQYLELRSALPQLYDLDGNNYTFIDTARELWDNTVKFQLKYPDFIGARLIYTPSRENTDQDFDGYLYNALALKEKFPFFFAGLDLFGHEDTNRPLYEYAHRLLAVQPDIKFFFHAGETNWYGTSSDENLIDAFLLGAKRFGHGYALTKHPEVLRLARAHNIAIEVTPISNQVLHYIHDLRNHPIAPLLATGYPIVIASDTPSFWKATPLTHDFYVTFLGIASKLADLRLLKQLAHNSLAYSSLDRICRDRAFAMWEAKWNKWIEQMAINTVLFEGIEVITS